MEKKNKNPPLVSKCFLQNWGRRKLLLLPWKSQYERTGKKNNPKCFFKQPLFA
jgi:hypothetical protein